MGEHEGSTGEQEDEMGCSAGVGRRDLNQRRSRGSLPSGNLYIYISIETPYLPCLSESNSSARTPSLHGSFSLEVVRNT